MTRGHQQGVRSVLDQSTDVIVAARRGEEWALTSLYRSIQPALLRYLAACAPEDDEDLAMEVWLDVAAALPRFSGSLEDLNRLVFTIARRRAIDHGRKRRRRRTEPVGVERFERIPGSIDPEAVVLDSMSGHEAARLIREVLTPEQAEVVLLRVVAGLSVSEVASVVGRRPSAISVIQHRALRRLAARLSDR